LPNKPDVILAELEPFKANISGIVVESTFNWYWFVDLLMDIGYCLHLANPAAIQKYKGLKHSDDNHDAFWLGHMLRLKILPEGYISSSLVGQEDLQLSGAVRIKLARNQDSCSEYCIVSVARPQIQLILSQVFHAARILLLEKEPLLPDRFHK
jgi:hypothetical protein